MSLSREVKTMARGWRWGHRPQVPRSVEAPELDRSEFPTEWARSKGGRAARRAILGLGFRPLLSFETNVRVFGAEALDDVAPPVIFVANHSSHLDAPLILTSLPEGWREWTAVGAASDYFFDVWWRAVATALAFNAFPVERAGSRRTSGLGAELLAEGWNVLVFPEGTRSRDGWMGDFRRGTARLAQQAGVPVVPIGIRGSYQAMPRGRSWPASGRPPVNVRFGPPLHPAADESVDDFGARMQKGLALLLEEDRSSWWDALRAGEEGRLDDARGPDAARWRRMWESSRPVSPGGRKRAWPSRRPR